MRRLSPSRGLSIAWALALITLLTSAMLLFGSCSPGSSTDKDVAKTYSIGDELSRKQPTPTDFDYSLERYNLIRRAYWVNGEREKAAAVPCPIADMPLGYIVLTDHGTILGRFTVDGKISSLNSYLTPDGALVYTLPIDRVEPIDEDGVYNSGYTHDAEMPDVDGSYGANDGGIFFFTPERRYMEWNGMEPTSTLTYHSKSTILY